MGSPVVTSKLAEGPVDLRGVRKRQRWIVGVQAIQTIDLEIDRHSLGRCRLDLLGTRALLPRLYRELSVEELGDGLRPVAGAIVDGLGRHDATLSRAKAIDAGAFERRDDARFSWDTIELDAEGMAEMSKLVADFHGRLLELEEECAARIEKGNPPVDAIYAIGGFELPPSGA